MNRFLLLACGLGLLLPPARLPGADVDFSHQIVPILRQYCGECHTREKKRGSFSMNTRTSFLAGGESGKRIVPGKSDRGDFLARITSDVPSLRMPPKGPRVPADKVALLRTWIDAGMPWQEGFTFGKRTYEPPLEPRRPILPAAVDGRTHPIDRILDAHLARNKLPRPKPIDDAAFVRRTSLDLVGLLPEPAVIERFARDGRPDKRARWIRELLDDRTAYAEHWLTFWNDLLRNDYQGTGFITGGRKQITGWLYRALLDDKPYDQFVRELVSPTPDADGFIRGIRWRGDVSASQTQEIQFAQNVAQAFLGLNLKCASCHDSFIDRWKLDDAYSLAAVYATSPLEIHRCDKALGRKAKPGWLFPQLGRIDENAAQPERLRQLAALVTHPKNGRLTRTIVNRLWHRLMGRGIVHPTDAMDTEPWSADLLDYLAVHLADSKFDLQKTLELIATSQAYQARSSLVRKPAEGPFLYTGPLARRMTAEQFLDSLWQITGVGPTRQDAPVLRGKPDAAGLAAIKLTGKWIGPSRQPPTGWKPGDAWTLRHSFTIRSRPRQVLGVVAANVPFTMLIQGKRLGKEAIRAEEDGVTLIALTGQVRTGKNEVVVGTPGNRTKTSPLVFVEIRVTADDGSEEIVASDATWEQAAVAIGPRDRGVPAGVSWKAVSTLPDDPPGKWPLVRLSLARARLAQTLPPRASLLKSDLFMRALGRPNRDQIVSMRPADLTTLEAIDLANHQTLADLLERGAKKILTRRWASTDDLVNWVYRFALSRSPTADERAAAGELLGVRATEQGVEDLLWAVCMLPEFQLIR